MDFNSKNFRYVTEPFSSFMAKAARGEAVYLRALSEAKPTESPANLQDDFPTLADDFQLPEELSLIKDRMFSSVLRISGRAKMWLHYDVSKRGDYELPRLANQPRASGHGKRLYSDPRIKAYGSHAANGR